MQLFDRAARRWRFPVAFLTNGGGVTEAEKAAQLSTWLGADVDGSQARARPPAGRGASRTPRRRSSAPAHSRPPTLPSPLTRGFALS